MLFVLNTTDRIGNICLILYSLILLFDNCLGEMLLVDQVNIAEDIRRYFRSKNIVFISTNYSIASDLKQYKTFTELPKNNGLREVVGTVVMTSIISHQLLGRLPAQTLIVLLGNKSPISTLIKQISESINISKFIWLLFLEPKSTLDTIFAEINIPFDCLFLVAQSEDNTIGLTEVYRITPSYPLQTYSFGNWTSKEGLRCPGINLYSRRSNLQGIYLKTGARKWRTKRGEDVDPGYYIGSVWNLLQKTINFTANYCIPEDNSSGSKRKNGSWSGVMGMMQKGELDVSNIPLVMTPSRATVVNFTFPLLSIRTYILIKKPNKYQMKWTVFLSPFSWHLWFVIIFVIVLISVCLTVFNYLRIHLIHLPDEGFDIVTSVFLTLSAYLQQGHSYPTKNAAILVLIATTYLSAVVLLATYTAAFTSHFTVPRPWMPFTTFWDFLQDKSYKLGVMPNTAQASYFERTDDQLLSKIYDKKVVPYRRSLPKDDIEGLQRLCTRDNYALATNTYNLISMDFSPNCTITPIPKAFIPASIAIAISMNSPYRGLFNYKLENLRAHGVLQRIYKAQWKNVYEDKGTPDMFVSIQEIAPVLLVLIFGIITGIIILFIECIIYHSRRKCDSYANSLTVPVKLGLHH